MNGYILSLMCLLWLLFALPLCCAFCGSGLCLLWSYCFGEALLESSGFVFT